MEKGVVFEIQRFAVHDGGGIRTNVFFKGCPIRCKWCCNPESQRKDPEIGYMKLKCIACGACGAVCPHNAVSALENGDRKFQFDICAQCIDKPCVKNCSARAVSLFGQEMTVDEIMTVIDKDRDFYINSGGGVTISGGEPLLQADFVTELLRACVRRGYNTAMETCSHVSFECYEKVIPYVDTFLCDIKHTDPVKFREWTGGDLDLILDNLRKLAPLANKMVARVPLIPGFNDDDETIVSIARFASEIGLKELNILPYHRLGKSKYDKLGRDYPMGDVEVPEENKVKHFAELVKNNGIKNVEIGG